MSGTALIVGSSGIVGSAAARLLVDEGWRVFGLARRPVHAPGVTSLPADLQDADALAKAVSGTEPNLVVLATWLRQATEPENVRVNGMMVRNLLGAVRPEPSVRHVALVTGGKHYLGPFESWETMDTAAETPFREDRPRLDLPNFYYAQEDEVFTAAARDGFTWSVHRPSTIIGKAVGNAMNMGTTLAVYATVSRETGRPFHFPGSQMQWERLGDLSDARQIARQILWASTTPAAANEAFNIVNGDVVRWKSLWPRIAGWFGIEAAQFDGTVRPLAQQMAEDAPVWREIAARHGLVEPDIDRLISPWHTDGDLGRPIEVLSDMSKSRKLGFSAYQATDDAFFDLFDELRADRIIP